MKDEGWWERFKVSLQRRKLPERLTIKSTRVRTITPRRIGPLALNFEPPPALIAATENCLKAIQATEPNVTKEARTIAARAFYNLFKKLPPLEGTSPMTVPLYELLPDIGLAIMDFCAPFYGRDARAAKIFYSLRKQLLDNEAHASKANPYDPKRKLIHANEYKATPEELIRLYLAHTPFYDFFHYRVRFHIPRRAFNEHGAMFAKAGHGKTQTLRTMLANFLQEDDPPALFIMDSLGSLIEDVDKLEVFSTRLKDRLVILDPTDERPPALNLFKLGSNTLYYYLFKSIDQSLTPRQATMISNLMLLMQQIEGATLETLIKVCEARQNLYPEAVERLPSVAKSFLLNQIYCKKPDELVMKTKSQVAQRVYAIAGMGKFNEMFSAPDNKFDAYRCMREKKIVLINTDAREAEQGGLGEASPVFGRFILAQVLAAARRRPKNERHLALLIVDEAKHYMDEHAALILSDARQYGLGMLLATQFPHQLEKGVQREINTNTSIKMMGPVEYAVASQYDRDMFTTPEFIMGMKSYDRSHAEWAAYVTNLTHRALKLSVPFGVIDAMPKMDGATHKALRAANMARYGAEPAALKDMQASRTNEPASPARPEKRAAPEPPPQSTKPRKDVPGPKMKPGKKW